MVEGENGLYTLKELLAYGEWARVNGERHRGNLQKNGIELYKQFKKEEDEKRRNDSIYNPRGHNSVFRD